MHNVVYSDKFLSKENTIEGIVEEIEKIIEIKDPTKHTLLKSSDSIELKILIKEKASDYEIPQHLHFQLAVASLISSLLNRMKTNYKTIYTNLITFTMIADKISEKHKLKGITIYDEFNNEVISINYLFEIDDKYDAVFMFKVID